MAIRVVTVTPPAAGADWTFTVPGQWYPYLYGVTAVLTTSTPVTTIPDETGNGHDATLVPNANYTGGVQGPFAGGLQNYAVDGASSVSSPNNVYAKSAASLALNTATFAQDGWVMLNPGTLGIADGIWSLFFPPASGSKVGLNAAAAIANPHAVTVDWSNVTRFTVAAFASTGVWHHFGLSYDGANFTLYRDGALINTTAGVPPGVGTAVEAQIGGNNGGGGRMRGRQAGTAFYPNNLAGATFAAHAAVTSSWAAYRAAVLADTPTAFYGLNTIPTGPSRVAILKITDGTREVLQVPANFASATAQSFTWSWQVLGPGAQASTDGQINSVAIPEIAVGAGYVISAHTLDLTGTDQWGPITLWFDDGAGSTPAGGGVNAPYLNALLVPDYSHRT